MKISVDTITLDVEGRDWRTQVTVDAFGTVTKIAPRFASQKDDGYAREQMIDAGLIRATREGDFIAAEVADIAGYAIRRANDRIQEGGTSLTD